MKRTPVVVFQFYHRDLHGIWTYAVRAFPDREQFEKLRADYESHGRAVHLERSYDSVQYS
jgi:hypothetical protein